MPYQNRVSPDGCIHATPEKGDFMGNRGVIHDARTKLLHPTTRWKNKAWIVSAHAFDADFHGEGTACRICTGEFRQNDLISHRPPVKPSFMRANYKLQRLFVTAPLASGAAVVPDSSQTNYLVNVLRMAEGGEVLLFNGRDGEWRAHLLRTGKKTVQLVATTLERPQPAAPDLVFAFAPLKVGRLDYMVQKAVEMGVGVLQPVTTDFTQNHRLAADKMRAWAIEAAEQCGVLAVPETRAAIRLDALLAQWDVTRTLIFCDEAHGTDNPLAILQGLLQPVGGLLIGPEGGFSDDERLRLRALAFVAAIPLGPRILRADTAAVAALTAVQMTKGDWG